MVGGRKVDLLQDIKYDLQGHSSSFFESQHERFHPVRQRNSEVIEVAVTEITGEHVNFPTQYPNRQTLVTLHFKRKV